jgi:NAD(P)-dependent dehydrogenase (short-subunit alcohol dehydrogenase family)
MRLQDKVAIITGGARGIGRAMALGFGREGAKVVIADIRTELADSAVAEIEKAGGVAAAFHTDVSKLDQLDRLVERTMERFGQIDILCNNAGVICSYRDVFAHTEEDWDNVINVNLKSAFFASQKVARAMIDKGNSGAILNTSSTSAFISSSTAITSYDISKAGLRQLTVSLAVHLADHRIRVNAIAPGTINTEFGAAGMDPEVRRARMAKRAQEVIPMKRLGQPEDLVGAAVFLCSSDSDYVTGHTLVVDGGILAF